MQIERRKRVAKLTSDILNPFLVSVVVIILLSIKSTASPFDALKWSLITITLSVLPVLIVVVYFVRKKKLDGIFISTRRQRNRIYLPAIICAIISCVILTYLGAPLLMVATFLAGLLAIVTFMCINLWWKISLHSAFVAASITILIVTYGSIGAVATVLFPPIAWAKIELGHHSLTQVATGALLAALIVVVVFYLFGLVGTPYLT